MLIYRMIRHVLLFITMILLFSWVVFQRDGTETAFFASIDIVVVNALFFFGYAYLTAYILLPFVLLKKRYLLFTILFLSSGFLISFLKFVISDYLFYNAIAADLSGLNAHINQILVNTKDMTFIVAIFLIVKYSKDNYYMQVRLRELHDSQAAAEIKLLSNQLDPHVVFNNLNNLYSIALNKPEEVLPNIKRLHLLLKYFFLEGKDAVVPLKRELDVIASYIGLEQLRYGNRLTVQYQLSGDPGAKLILPLLLFAFVENSFEYGCGLESGKSWIRIRVNILPELIDFHISNNKPRAMMLEARDHSSASKHQIREKLNLMYPRKYQLIIDDQPEEYVVDLKLKI